MHTIATDYGRKHEEITDAEWLVNYELQWPNRKLLRNREVSHAADILCRLHNDAYHRDLLLVRAAYTEAARLLSTLSNRTAECALRACKSRRM